MVFTGYDYSSGLGALGKGVDAFAGGLKQRAQEQALRGALQDVPLGPDGRPDLQAAAMKLLGAGMVQPAVTLANLGASLADRDTSRQQWQQQFGLQQQQFSRQNQNDERAARQQDRSFRIQEEQLKIAQNRADTSTPDGRARVAGQYGLQPGTAEHKQYILTGKVPEEKPRNLSVGDIGKLTEEGTKFQSVSGFGNTFRDNFAGYGNSMIGGAAMLAGRTLPNAVLPQGTEDAAKWWQEYDRYKNVIRNDLFGSALTATEKAAFEAADITPAMKPEIIKTNLAKQKGLIEAGLKRKAAAMVQSGYSADAVTSAFGMSPEQLGIAGMGKAGALSQSLAPAQQGAPKQPPVPGARQAPDGKFYAPDPNRPGKWLRVDD